MYNILDDMGENKQFMRGERLLETIYVRGRHFACSTFTSVQSYKMFSLVLRKNATAFFFEIKKSSRFRWNVR